MVDLAKKRCKPSNQFAKPISEQVAKNLMSNLSADWRLDSDSKSISRSFIFKNYHETIGFVNAIAWIANQESHHPNLVVAFNRCDVEYMTHSIGGLSVNDFICAAKIDAINNENIETSDNTTSVKTATPTPASKPKTTNAAKSAVAREKTKPTPVTPPTKANDESTTKNTALPIVEAPVLDFAEAEELLQKPVVEKSIGKTETTDSKEPEIVLEDPDEMESSTNFENTQIFEIPGVGEFELDEDENSEDETIIDIQEQTSNSDPDEVATVAMTSNPMADFDAIVEEVATVALDPNEDPFDQTDPHLQSHAQAPKPAASNNGAGGDPDEVATMIMSAPADFGDDTIDTDPSIENDETMIIETGEFQDPDLT